MQGTKQFVLFINVYEEKGHLRTKGDEAIYFCITTQQSDIITHKNPNGTNDNKLNDIMVCKEHIYTAFINPDTVDCCYSDTCGEILYGLRK